MKLSRKSDYALHALLLLADPSLRGPLSVRALAEEHGMPRKFLEAIMRELRDQGLVESIAGKNGGYNLLVSPKEISLIQVIRCFDAPLLEVQEPDADSPLSPPLEKVRRVIRGIGLQLDLLLESTTLEDILNNRPIHYLITSESEFAFGEGI